MDTTKNFTCKTEVLTETLLTFFKDKYNYELFSSVINKKTKVSLRILDWLVTNYSKKNNSIIETFENNALTTFKIYLDYKNQLRAYSKNNFDPFCRKNRIIIDPDTMKVVPRKINDRCFSTTIGQMNFFRWVIKNNIINYLLLNIDAIENDMIDISNSNKNKNNKKRCCLSENNYKKMSIYHGPIVVKF